MKKISLSLVLLSLLIVLSACTHMVYDDPSAEGVGYIRQLETVYIGAMLPLSSESADEAANMQAAMEVAADIINNSHDLDWDLAKNAGLKNYGNAKIELVVRDTGATLREANTAATELIEMGVPLMVGAYNNDFTAAVATACNKLQVPMICGSAKSVSLTDGSYDFAPYFNRISPSPNEETESFLEYINQLNLTTNAGIKKVAVAYINNDYGITAATILRNALESSSLELVAFISYEATDTDLVEEAANMLINEPDCLIHISSTDDLKNFANIYAKATGMPELVLCYSGGFQRKSFAAEAGKLAVNYYQGWMVRPDLLYRNASPNVAEDGTIIKDSREIAGDIFIYINKLYREKTGTDMDNVALLEFASIIVAAQVVDMAGTTDRQTLNDLLKTAEFAAPYLYSGSISFGEDGQNTNMAAYIAEIASGQYRYKY